MNLSDWPALLGLVAAGSLAGGVNAVAGGGSLVSFPALVWAGLPEIPANATNAVGLVPGSFASAIGFRNQFEATKKYLGPLLWPAIIGSSFGAWLLIHTSPQAFRVIVPILIFIATLLLALQPQIKEWSAKHERHSSIWTGVILQLIVSVYGGYFGAGMGIMMLAAFGLFMNANIHELNAVKSWLAVIINLVAAIVFVGQGAIVWLPAAAITVGSILGGFFGAKWSQKVDSERLRKCIVVYGFVMVAWFTYKVLAK